MSSDGLSKAFARSRVVVFGDVMVHRTLPSRGFLTGKQCHPMAPLKHVDGAYVLQDGHPGTVVLDLLRQGGN